MPRAPWSLVSFMFSSLFLPLLGFAQTEKNDIPYVDNPVHATAELETRRLAPGATTELIIQLEVVEHYIAYQDQFEIIPGKSTRFKVSDLKIEPLVEFHDVVSKKQKKGVRNRGTIRTLIEMPEKLSGDLSELTFELKYQACTSQFCLFPSKIHLKVPIEVVHADEMFASKSNASSAAVAEDDFSKTLEKGFLYAFLMVFGFGLLTSLTPCVYPMIPITLALIGTQSAGMSRAKSFVISFIYVCGIATTYAILGMIAALSGQLFGALLGNIWVVTALALFFAAMGLSLMGVFEIQTPLFLQNRLQSGGSSSGKGLGKAYFTGLVAGLVASPCVGPVLFAVLAYIAQTRNMVLGASLLVTFAFGLGVLLILVGTFSSVIQLLPKSGPWMVAVKTFFGLIFFGAAFYYIYPVYPPWLFQLLLGLFLVIFAGAHGAFLSASQASSTGQRIRKSLLLATLIVGAALLARLALQALPEPDHGAKTAKASENSAIETRAEGEFQWQTYDDALIEEAASSGVPVLIDFYADWCTACVEMEEKTFSNAQVRAALKNHMLLKVDNTNSQLVNQAILQKYGVLSLPTFIFIDGSGQVRKDLTLRKFESPEEFLTRLGRLNNL